MTDRGSDARQRFIGRGLDRLFHRHGGYPADLSESASALPECSDARQTTEIRQTPLAAAEQVSGRVHQVIIAFQFYDKSVQRLGHVTHSLDALSNSWSGISSASSIRSNGHDLQENTRAKYTTPDEREMFEAVRRGVPASKAIEQYVEAPQKQAGRRYRAVLNSFNQPLFATLLQIAIRCVVTGVMPETYSTSTHSSSASAASPVERIRAVARA
ncbi:MAG: hypothetical protein IPL58_10050 [Betaproteobacteria bacterium]|uniref:Uncharacterized protein n=1 Tax=Candidatus Proximibacter danicus TaxID=2954365 RepID=A0A9D7K2P1_9PROT|nr:hypothetical protein [Candidatus Proximibacter danicus]